MRTLASESRVNWALGLLAGALLLGLAQPARATATPTTPLATTSSTTAVTTTGTTAGATAGATTGTTATPGAAGTSSSSAEPAPVDVLKVSGLLDPIVADNIEQAIGRAETDGAQALVVQLTTDGAVVDAARMSRLLERVADAKVPIAVWIGQSRSTHAYGWPAQLVGVADALGMVPGSRLGHTGDPLTVHGKPVDLGPVADELRHGTMSFTELRQAGALKLSTTADGMPTVRSMVGALDGFVADGRTLDTLTDRVDDKGGIQSTITTVRFADVGGIDGLMHTVASPAMAYLLFIIGACLLIFEFFTAGIGIAGVIGALCVALGCYGFAALPTRGWAIGLLVASLVAFAVDAQVGIPRFWTAAGILMFVPASFFLFRSLPGSTLRVPYLTLAVGVAGVLLTFIVGMPSMVRTRFATPTIGREWMIGSLGTAVATIDPNGLATVAGATWRARTNRATPIAAGAALRVVGIDGVTLDVEPEEGGARDYRERRHKTAASDTTPDVPDASDEPAPQPASSE